MPAPRKSALLHDVHGTSPKNRTTDESVVPSGRPKFPKDLNPAMRPTFKRIVKLLEERRAVTAGDVELIRLYAILYDRHTRNVAAMIEEGEVCTYFRLDSNGVSVPQVKRNIRFEVITAAERQMESIIAKLGLTPTAKDRVKPSAVNPDEEIIPGSLADLHPELFTGGKKK
jgi:P27 family predicted phage terminase small subunit